METKARIAIGILALAVSAFPALAQGQQQNPPPPQQGQGQAQGQTNGQRNTFGYRRTGPGGGGPGGPMVRQGFGAGQMGGRGFGGGPMSRSFGRRGPMGMGGRRGGGRGMGMRAGGFGEMGFSNSPAMRQRLGITADQETKIHQQDLDFQKAQIQDRATLQVKRLELNELLAADNPDHAAIDAKLQEVSAAQMASEKASIDNRLALRDILTPAQRQQLKQLRTNGFQQSGGSTQNAAPRTGGRGGRGPAGRGTPPPAPPQGQTPANQ